ncbi:MAG: ABC transporter permease [Phycisphaerales bacterium JB050]
MFGQTLSIARNTFVEAIRQPIYFVLILAGSLMQVFNVLLAAYSMDYTEEGLEVQKDNKLLLDMGLATVLVICTLLAAFIATNVLSKEIENKTALTVISKPIGRPVFIFGKFLGVSAAMTMAFVTLLAFFLLAMRHEVMSTARDSLNWSVIVTGGLALVVSVGAGIWGNFFYGWVFSSTTTRLLAPLSIGAWGITLLIERNFKLRDFGAEDYVSSVVQPQVLLAAGAILLAMLVLTALALCVSTRLGQVMTIVVCAGVFIGGLMSNYLLGRYAFVNEHFAVVDTVNTEFEDDTINQAGNSVSLTLTAIPNIDIEPGQPVYFGPAPNGVALAVPKHQPFTGDVTRPNDLVDPDKFGRSLAVQAYDAEERELTIVNAGGLPVSRMPREGDYLFMQPTRHNAPALAAWSIVPNLQSYWLVDAITQGHPIPARYIGLVVLYTAFQITGFLSLSVMLFQTRDVG